MSLWNQQVQASTNYQMKSKSIPRALIALAATSFLGSPAPANAAVVGFEGIPGADNQQWYLFSSLGVAHTYAGFRWGYGTDPGPANANFVDPGGWALSHINNQGSDGWPAPNGVTGNYYASNANGIISLWIDFQEAVTFTSGEFSWLTPTNPPGPNSSTIQLFGYADSAGNIGSELHSSAVTGLNETLTELSANFTNIRFLEIRSNSGDTWFAVDNLQIGDPDISPIPEPGSTLALGLLLASALGLRHRRRSAATGE